MKRNVSTHDAYVTPQRQHYPFRVIGNLLKLDSYFSFLRLMEPMRDKNNICKVPGWYQLKVLSSLAFSGVWLYHE